MPCTWNRFSINTMPDCVFAVIQDKSFLKLSEKRWHHHDSKAFQKTYYFLCHAWRGGFSVWVDQGILFFFSNLSQAFMFLPVRSAVLLSWCQFCSLSSCWWKLWLTTQGPVPPFRVASRFWFDYRWEILPRHHRLGTLLSQKCLHLDNRALIVVWWNSRLWKCQVSHLQNEGFTDLQKGLWIWTIMVCD